MDDKHVQLSFRTHSKVLGNRPEYRYSPGDFKTSGSVTDQVSLLWEQDKKLCLYRNSDTPLLGRTETSTTSYNCRLRLDEEVGRTRCLSGSCH